MINSASVLFAYCKEGTNCKDEDFREQEEVNNDGKVEPKSEDEEESSIDAIEKVYRWIEDMWMQDAAGSLSSSASAAIAISSFLLHYC